MKKFKQKLKWVLLALPLSLALGTSAVAAEKGALEVDITGMGPAADRPAVSLVHNTLGKFVLDGNAQKYVVYGYGIEGGFFACVELSPLAKQGALDDLEHMLSKIKPNPMTTGYRVKQVEQCRK